MTDSNLLASFAQADSQQAFTDLVACHADWVYSAALRLVRDPALADDVTQAVFLLLSQRAKDLNPASLNAWLFKVTRYAAANAIRTRSRREKHERRAAAMNCESKSPDPEHLWEEISPMLEQSVANLPAADRDVVLLRFYQRKSMAEVGASIGVSEAAAKKRVAKAVEKMRGYLRAAGIIAPAAALATAIYSNTTHAAAASIALSAAAKSPSAQIISIAKGANTMLLMAKLKFAAVVVLLIALIPLGVAIALQSIAAPDGAGKSGAAIAAAPITAPAKIEFVAPFIDSQTCAVLHIDFTKTDVVEFAHWWNKLFAGTDKQDTISVDEPNLIGGFRKAGGRDMNFIWQQFAGMIGGETVQLVVPVYHPGDRAEIKTHLMNGALDSMDTQNALIFARAPGMQTLKSIKPTSRPDLGDAMAAGADAPILFVFVPSRFLNDPAISTSIPGIAGLQDARWTTAVWAAISIAAPPNGKVTLQIECKDADSATALAGFIDGKLQAMKNDPTAQQLLGEEADRLPVVLEPSVSGKRISMMLDQPSIDRLVLMLIPHHPNPPHTTPEPVQEP